MIPQRVNRSVNFSKQNDMLRSSHQTERGMTTRRDFLSRSALTAAAGLGSGAFSQSSQAQLAESVKQMQPPRKPIIITRDTGDTSIDEAYKMLLDGADTLDACNHVCS